jgi:hypothetical protein
LLLALRVPLLVIVPIAFFWFGASLRGRAFFGPIAAAVVGVTGLGILAATTPVVWLLAVGLAPALLGWGISRLAPRRPPPQTR